MTLLLESASDHSVRNDIIGFMKIDLNSLKHSGTMAMIMAVIKAIMIISNPGLTR